MARIGIAALGCSLVVFALATVAVPPAAVAQQAQPTLYAEVDCMHSTSPDYEAVETEIWQPMHQEAVKRGIKSGWLFYAVRFGDMSDCDYYTVNQFAGEAQLNDPTSYEDLFAAVHPGKSWDEALARTLASRRILRSELWTMVDGIPAQEFAYAQVNLMSAQNGTDYTAMESEVWKPVHEALQQAGHRAGWGVWQLTSPAGASVPYNYATVDLLKALGPVPVTETFAKVHPNADMDVLMERTNAARTFVRSETWWLIAHTESQ